MDINKLAAMSEERICNLVFWAGYVVKDVPGNSELPAPGKRIGGSLVTHGKDHWQSAANLRLFEIQEQRATPTVKRIMQMVGF